MKTNGKIKRTGCVPDWTKTTSRSMGISEPLGHHCWCKRTYSTLTLLLVWARKTALCLRTGGAGRLALEGSSSLLSHAKDLKKPEILTKSNCHKQEPLPLHQRTPAWMGQRHSSSEQMFIRECNVPSISRYWDAAVNKPEKYHILPTENLHSGVGKMDN